MVQRRWPNAARILEQYENKDILDIGCAFYTGVPKIAGERNTVVQADIDHDFLEQLQDGKEMYYTRTGDELYSSVVNADATYLPFPADSFDVIYGGAFLNVKWKNMSKMIDYPDTDLERVLRPEGDMIFTHGRFSNIDTAEDVLDALEATDLYAENKFKSYLFTHKTLHLENYQP